LNTKREIENCIQTAAYTEFDWETVENKMMYTVSALIIDDAIHQNENTGVFFKI
jgi:hypothetical protein